MKQISLDYFSFDFGKLGSKNPIAMRDRPLPFDYAQTD